MIYLLIRNLNDFEIIEYLIHKIYSHSHLSQVLTDGNGKEIFNDHLQLGLMNSLVLSPTVLRFDKFVYCNFFRENPFSPVAQQ